jgi:NTP pyrophosphatase (non-canonical NTP hydrolase)
MSPDRFESLARELAAFVAAREWEPFHTPKNLAMALSAEAGELLEHFLWLTPEESRALGTGAREEVALEMADVLLFLLRLAQQLDVDLLAAAERKLALNAVKYPVEKARGRATKYDKL